MAEQSVKKIGWCAMHNCRPDKCIDYHNGKNMMMEWAIDNLQAVIDEAKKRGIKFLFTEDPKRPISDYRKDRMTADEIDVTNL